MLPPERWIPQTRDVLVESVRRHLMADVEVGADPVRSHLTAA